MTQAQSKQVIYLSKANFENLISDFERVLVSEIIMPGIKKFLIDAFYTTHISKKK